VTSPEPASTGVAPAAVDSEHESEITRAESRADKLESRSAPRGSEHEVVVQIAPSQAVPPQFAAPPDVSVTAKRTAEAPAPAAVAVAPVLADEAQRELQALQDPAPPQYESDPSANAAVQATAAQAQASATKPPARYEAEVHDLSEVTVTAARRKLTSAATGAGPRNTVRRANSYADEEVAGDAAAPATQPASYSDPERWLEAIRELRKEGKTREADLEWKRFHAAFPDHPVPESDTARPQR
jgi:hypothetical protein